MNKFLFSSFLLLKSDLKHPAFFRSITTMNGIKNPDETPSSGASSPWKSYNPDTMAPGARYSLCISSVVPRPVGVLTTLDPGTGIVNCAPFSYSSLSTHDPPIVTHGICMSNGKKKDSLRNIEATGEWVFNVLEVGYLEQANDTSSPMVSLKIDIPSISIDAK